jgi:GNAT superfamily N-acetyltransferase
MPPAIRIRPATPDDAALVTRFIRALAEYERLLDECEATEAQVRASLFGDRPQAEVVIADVDGEPAGFALFFHNYSTFLARHGLYLEDLFVAPEHRGRGVGRALLAHLARLAVERGCGRLEWWVLDWNEPAIRFYESVGAAPQSEWVRYRLAGDALRAFADGAPIEAA